MTGDQRRSGTSVAMATSLVAAILVFMTSHLLAQEELRPSPRPWKGSAILGNGRLCVVYSDDKRVGPETGSGGIRHLYFQDYG